MNLCQNNLGEGSTIWEAMKWAEEVLQKSGRPDAAIDAKLLMLYVLECSDTMLLLNRQKVIEPKVLETYKAYVSMRQIGVPLQHITGTQEFMGIEFKVNEHVLIPRQDTESLIEKVLEKLGQSSFGEKEALCGLDIGTGTGCIGISLAHYLPKVTMTLIDVSKEALKVANENIQSHGMQNRIWTLESNLFEAYKGGKVDFIVSNPPYIAKKDMEELMIEVRDYEPHLALTDEGDGLYFYREISAQAKNYLADDGLLAYEIGYDQGEAVTKLLKVEGYDEIELHKDLAGADRVVLARWKGQFIR